MSACGATANPRPGVALRCDRTAGHESTFENGSTEHIWHYDFHQDATWFVDAWGAVRISYRTVVR